jgi:hypothetical protein
MSRTTTVEDYAQDALRQHIAAHTVDGASGAFTTTYAERAALRTRLEAALRAERRYFAAQARLRAA